MTAMQNLSVEQLQSENSLLQNKILYLEEQLAWLKRQIFGKKSERIISDANKQQLELEGFENISSSSQEQKQSVAAHSRCTPNRHGQDKVKLPSDLPVERIFLDLSEEEKTCKETGLSLIKIGEEISYKLAYKPGSYYLKEIVRPKYAYPKQEEKGISIAPLPESILPRCQADNSLLSDILVRKFCDHLPLYRISEIFSREGIVISRKLLSQWVIKCGLALAPLYDEMLRQILSSQNIFVDETPIDMQDKEKVKQGYMWVVVGGNSQNPPYRIYDFRENRCHENLSHLIGNYQGVLHSDKYGAYENMAAKKQITWCPCWSHVRRKFFEAEGGDLALRDWVLRKIRYLFLLEKVAWARSPEERLKVRQEKEVPLIDELVEKIKAKLTDGRILPKSKLSEAIRYFCGLIPYLKNYTKLPYARLENNVAERAIRPLAIGRKNWLFFGSAQGGKAAGVIFSLVQTCRGLGINPREYLEDIFGRLMSHNAQKLQELLPDRWQQNRQTSAGLNISGNS